MSQIFSADAQQVADGKPLVGTTETVDVSTNPLQPPFNTSKAKVIALVVVVPGADQTSVAANIYRNYSGERLLVGGTDVSVPAAGLSFPIAIGIIDQIPDQRAVSYTLTLQQQGGTDDGSTFGPDYIEATLISG